MSWGRVREANTGAEQRPVQALHQEEAPVPKIMVLKCLSWMRKFRLRRVKYGCLLVLSLLLFTYISVFSPEVLPYNSGHGVRRICLTPHSMNASCSTAASGRPEGTDKRQNDSHTCKPRPLEQLLENCEDLKLHHGYHWWPMSREETRFPLAFGVKVHHKPHMLERLLRVIWRPHNFYCIHVDKKTPDDVFVVFKRLADCFHNVLLTDVRIRLVYASIYSLKSDIECMKMALKSSVPWKYYLNLSGQEFPLKTNLEIVQILTLLNGKNDIQSHPHTAHTALFYNRKHVIAGDTIYYTADKKAPFKRPIEHRKGSAYGAFSRPFLEYVLQDQLAMELLEWLNDTWASDEAFWATLNYLPGIPGGLRANVSHDEGTFLSRALVWGWEKYKCQGYYARHVCVFGHKDLPWLLKRPELIANKFDPDADPVVLDCLEKLLEKRALAAFRGKPLSVGDGGLNWTFYRSLPHVLEH